MRRFKAKLQEVIQNPDKIYQSKINKNTSLYFKKHKKFYIMIAVDFTHSPRRGYVKTGFPVYNLKKGAKIIWKKS